MQAQKRIPLDFESKNDIIGALLLRGTGQKRLFAHARQVREGIFSGRVEARSVIEYSNTCQQACNYCGINRHSKLKRYILSDHAFLTRIKKLYESGNNGTRGRE